MEVAVAAKGQKPVELDDNVFGVEFKPALVHQVVKVHFANEHIGTKKHKTRGQVRGGGAKPWRQKGTGRARAGTIRSPIWRGGGVTFAPKAKQRRLKINQKMHNQAVRCVLSQLLREERVKIVPSLELKEPKTKLVAKMLQDLGLSKVLIISETVDPNLFLAARNIPNVEVRHVDSLDMLSLLSFDNLLMTVAAAKQLEEMLR